MNNKNDIKPIVMNKRDLSRMDRIRKAGLSQTMVTIKYKDKKGNLSQRTVEPYKLSGNDFWAYDPNKESIRRFKVKGLQSLKLTKTKFDPRWDIEMEEMIKQANNYYDFDGNKKIQAIEDAFKDNKLAKEVAYMIATSHEYKKPNTKSAIRLVKNYNWSQKKMNIDKMQGINKPVDKEKVFNIAGTLNLKTVKPFMVVDKFQGITPQSPEYKILLDGHHRKEACELKGIKEVPVYYGKYNGKAEKDINELIDKKSNEILGGISKMAGKMKENYDFNAYNALGENGIEDKKNRTSFVKDRIIPNVRNKVFGGIAGAGGALTGAGIGYGISKIKQDAVNRGIRRAGSAIVDKALENGVINQESANKVMNSLSDGRLRKAKGILAAGAGAIALAPKAKELGKVVERTSSLRKKHLKEFGTEPTEEDYEEVARLNPDNKLHEKTRELFYTPETIVKSKKRDESLGRRMDRESEGNAEKTSGLYVNEIEKLAVSIQKSSIPKITSGILAVPGAYLGAKAVKTSLDPDDKHPVIKKGLGAVAGGSLAGGLGYGLGKDGVDVIDKLSDIYKNTSNTGKEVMGKANKEISKVKDYREAINVGKRAKQIDKQTKDIIKQHNKTAKKSEKISKSVQKDINKNNDFLSE